MKFCAIDLFSGAGGLTLGLKRAGFSVVGAVEVDGSAAATYRANHQRVLLKHVDIRRLSPRKFRKELNLRRGELDLLAGCPPCQGFSVLRTRNGSAEIDDERNILIRQLLRFTREFRPKAVMMENVPRLMFHVTFKEFCAELECLGYKVCYDIKNAAQFGVPQRRKRLILLAGKGFNIPFARENHNIYTVRNAIGSLAEPEKSSDPLHNLRAKKRTLKIQKLISEIPKNGGSRSDLPRKRQLGCHKRSNGFWDVYGRMAWDEVAPTITSGCANPSKGRFLHPAEDRAITLREAALLQSFPGSYEFDLSAGKEAIALLIGNALPPEFIRRHAVEIRTALKNRM